MSRSPTLTGPAPGAQRQTPPAGGAAPQSLQTVKHANPDQFYALRYLPAPYHRLVCGWLGLNDALAHIPAAVSTPPLGEIRLQWWREALAETVSLATQHQGTEELVLSGVDPFRAHPVLQDIGHGLMELFAQNEATDDDAAAAGLRAAISRLAGALDPVIEARARLLYDPAFGCVVEAAEWVCTAEGTMIQQLFTLINGAELTSADNSTPVAGAGDVSPLAAIVADGAGLLALARHRAVPMACLQVKDSDNHVTDYLKTAYQTWRGRARERLAQQHRADRGALIRPFLLAPAMVPLYARVNSRGKTGAGSESGAEPGAGSERGARRAPGMMTRHVRLAAAHLFGRL
ncbi:MAG: hypothetical protein AAFW83_00295 [Pseudomonadota bacterium]